jgi:hypothetical protein
MIGAQTAQIEMPATGVGPWAGKPSVPGPPLEVFHHPNRLIPPQGGINVSLAAQTDDVAFVPVVERLQPSPSNTGAGGSIS